jgi:hypothetical protein
LILAKFNRNNPVIDLNRKDIIYEDKRFKVNILLSDIYKYAGVKFKRNEIKENKILFYQPLLALQEVGLVETYLGKEKCTIILNEADIDINPEEVFLEITQYDDIESYYKYGLREKKYKICPNCGKAFKGNRQNNDKYCKDCTDKDSYNFHFIHCEDCGKRIKINNYNTKTTRCKECQSLHKKISDKNRNYAQR